MSQFAKVSQEMKSLANAPQAAILQRFFKTAKGQYGAGDVFLGIKVPQTRKIALKYVSLDYEDISRLLKSKIHELRLLALLILVAKYQKTDDKKMKAKIVGFYLKHTKHINNWDLVDLSAPNIVGNYLIDKNKDILYRLAKSSNLWEKRISVLATFAFIRLGEFKDSLEISKILLGDLHDLIHKSVGWMLREIGKRDKKILEKFLKENYRQIPRTMLRYAIEKFPETERKKWLNRNSLHF